MVCPRTDKAAPKDFTTASSNKLLSARSLEVSDAMKADLEGEGAAGRDSEEAHPDPCNKVVKDSEAMQEYIALGKELGNFAKSLHETLERAMAIHEEKCLSVDELNKVISREWNALMLQEGKKAKKTFNKEE